MKQKKLVIVINGKGSVGKDTLCDALKEAYKVTNVSAITPIKEIAKMLGWNGEKDMRSRRFLAELKRVFVEYNDLPNNYLLEEYEKFSQNDAEILCVHIRESDQIDHFVTSIKTPCITLLIRRSDEAFNQVYGNAADDDVENYNYDYIYDNNGTIEESSVRFRQFIASIIDKFYRD